MSCRTRMWLGPDGDHAAFIAPGTAVGCRAGVGWDQHFDAPLAAQAGARGVVTLGAGGVVQRHDSDGTTELWRLESAPLAAAGPFAVSPDGSWVFDGQHLVLAPPARRVREILS